MFSTQKVDINKLFSDGYCVTTIDKVMADHILRQMKQETWIEVQPDEGGFEDGSSEKYYTGRYMSAQSLLKPVNLRPSHIMFANKFKDWAQPVLQRFEMADRVNLSAFCGVPGYYMEAHTDVGDRAVFDVIAYFGDGINEVEDGGVLNMYKTDVTDPENPEKMRLVDQIVPSHGKIVIINNLSPIFYHEVTELVKKGVRRYQIVANFGMVDLPDWELDYEEKPGFLHADKPGTIGVPETILELLKNNDSKEHPKEDPDGI